jgi:trimethylguanosine synthase
MTKHNAQIYNVNHKIEFILGDFFTLTERLIGDVVFLSPPWGGPSYIHNNIYDLNNIMSPKGGIRLLEKSKKISNNVAFYLPKNINTLQV